jgi:sulfide:quinone oxidoreductase
MGHVPEATAYALAMTTSVLVLGAGFGGLEISSRLSGALDDQVEVTLIDRSDAFVFGFSKLDVMFGRRTPEAVRLRYRDYATPGVRFRTETITAIDPVARRVATDRGTYGADVLVVALGAEYDLSATPGLAEHGNEFYSVAGAEHVRDVLPGFRSGTAIVGVCGTPFKCPPAPNEAALLLDQFLRDRGMRNAVEIRVVVPFGVPLPPSPELSRAILARYEERGIEWIPNHRVIALDGASREAVLDDDTRLPYDLFLGIPVHRVPAVVSASGLAEDGWIPVEKGSGATRFPGVYAVGDVTNVGTPKAGVFAERAARVVADQLVARIRGEAEPPGYDGTGACWVELGNHEVGAIEVDFFSTPGHPTGVFTEPSDPVAAAKAEFGRERHARWFGLAGPA